MIWHYWTGTWDPANSKLNGHILCWKMSGKIPEEAPKDHYWHVTIVQAKVNCQQCLEWMHA